MTVAVSPARLLHDVRPQPASAWTLRLAHRTSPSRVRVRREVSSLSPSAAYVTLSPGLVAVIERSGSQVLAHQVLTHQEVGAAGMTVHQAWNETARSMRDAACVGGEVEFWVREASTSMGSLTISGLEVGGAAARWCAHPMLFRTLHEHFERVFAPAGELTYLTRDFNDLFVFRAPARDVARALPAPGGGLIMRYSLGFP
ncbi:hypothetical protein, partial [Corynebacterium sp. LK2510]|uniref:hypothetical protein n=1 Tax=Corynebacterium sp. LK2510 TaxID=3110472 RepID=UPI0034CE14D4